MNKEQIRSSLLLLLTATIWGAAFVAQSVGLEYVGPFTFNGIRFTIGGVVLLPCIAFLDRFKRRGEAEEQEKKNGTSKTLLLGGVCCGLLLFCASTLQQFGMRETDAGKAGFITTFYIVMVPVLGLIFKKRCKARVWVSVALAVAGLYLLCITEGFSVQQGDALIFLCAIVFAVHILCIDHFSPLADGVRMSAIQFFVSGGLSLLCMLLWEKPVLTQILEARLPILYAGVLSCGVAYTLQIVGQKGLNPTVASLLLSLESVVAVLAGALLLKERLTGREALGCVLMFAAIVLSQLPKKAEYAKINLSMQRKQGGLK